MRKRFPKLKSVPLSPIADKPTPIGICIEMAVFDKLPKALRDYCNERNIPAQDLNRKWLQFKNAQTVINWYEGIS